MLDLSDQWRSNIPVTCVLTFDLSNHLLSETNFASQVICLNKADDYGMHHLFPPSTHSALEGLTYWHQWSDALKRYWTDPSNASLFVSSIMIYFQALFHWLDTGDKSWLNFVLPLFTVRQGAWWTVFLCHTELYPICPSFTSCGSHFIHPSFSNPHPCLFSASTHALLVHSYLFSSFLSLLNPILSPSLLSHLNFLTPYI